MEPTPNTTHVANKALVGEELLSLSTKTGLWAKSIPTMAYILQKLREAEIRTSNLKKASAINDALLHFNNMAEQAPSLITTAHRMRGHIEPESELLYKRLNKLLENFDELYAENEQELLPTIIRLGSTLIELEISGEEKLNLASARSQIPISAMQPLQEQAPESTDIDPTEELEALPIPNLDENELGGGTGLVNAYPKSTKIRKVRANYANEITLFDRMRHDWV